MNCLLNDIHTFSFYSHLSVPIITIRIKRTSTFVQLKDKGISKGKCLVEEAEIIFCSYNYIIDPDIRESVRLMF